MSNDILTKRDGPVLRITINRPDEGNAMTDDMALELTRLLAGAEGNSEFVLLQGAGADFCVGRAGMARPAGAAAAPPPEALERRNMFQLIFDCYAAFRGSQVPIVGVVQGRALGFGCALAALCDITLASDAARFQVPEMLHNIMPTMVLSSFVDRVPRKAMSYLVYSAAEISAERALTFGIVSEVVPAAQLDGAVAKLCERLANTPQPALRGVKEYVRSGPSMDTQGAVDFARNLHAVVNSSSKMRK